ncbi:MAG: T9SS type A sorting domain-containing protein [Pedobacter sp.]|nr:MAG: T9SS type A sorting domain-containing protein [Pedobacter sp.]
MEVFSTIGTPSFATPSGIDNNLFKLNPTPPADILWNYRLGNPTVRKHGQFQVNLPGNEVAAIWNDKITRVNNVDYYSILIFDQNGTEINRSGLSTVGWSQLAVGYFTRTSGEMEIAAVPKTAIDGKYPVYIFRRGYKEPQQILHPDNTDASITISTDASHQLVVSFGVLPLKFLLLSAKADAMGKTVDLKWYTKNEVNTNGFVVERKIGEGNFLTIGNRASNNKMETNTYTFKDEEPAVGINYYRIKQLDVNGDFSHSEIVPAKIGANLGISIYPNPVEKLLNINHFEADTSARISVLSIDGKVLISHKVAIGLNFSSLDIVNLPKGTYTLVYTSQQEKSSAKFIKK